MKHVFEINGIQGVARGALEAGVEFAAGYPGGPITGIMSSLAREAPPGLHVEWCPNEKDAVAGAFGAALVGRRALAVVKHVGLSVASDAVTAASFAGIRGAMVIATGADPGGRVSQNEMDDRYFAELFMLPLLEPSSPADAVRLTRYAFELSERIGAPVLLRVSSAFLRIFEAVPDQARAPAGRPLADADGRPFRFEPTPERTALGRHILDSNRNRQERFARAAAELERAGLDTVDGDATADLGIVTCGPTLDTVRAALRSTGTAARILCLRALHPLPERAITAFAATAERVLVVEEIAPYLEERLARYGIAARGKLSGDLPGQGALDERDVAIALRRMAGQPVPPRPFEARRDEHLAPKLKARWADGCPIAAGHRGLREALDRMQDPLCIGGVGVVSWGCAPPFENLYSACCLGISPSVASGMFHAGTDHKELLAVMGDSSFCHSGVQSLMNAVHNHARITFIIFDNRRTAETEEGGQPNPSSPDPTGAMTDGAPAQGISLAALVRACGVEQLHQIDPHDTAAVRDAILQAVGEDRVSVVLLSAGCPSPCCTDPRG